MAVSGKRPHAHLDDGASGVTIGDQSMTKLSRINGAINKMHHEDLRISLANFHLNTSGVRDVLVKRLKHFYKRQRLLRVNQVLPPEERNTFEFLVVIDFEATCSETNENFVHEIIEFPAVLIDMENQTVCNSFQGFCKPRVNPVLTDFCTNLTGITQSQVDKAKDFTEVLKDFESWLSSVNLGSDSEFAVLTDGPWDMARFLRTQIDVSGIDYPWWAKQWINLRKVYTGYYGYGRVNLQQMLRDLGLEFQGRPHCGLDDARNIAAVVIQLLKDGCILRINERLHEDDNKALCPKDGADAIRQLEKPSTQQARSQCPKP